MSFFAIFFALLFEQVRPLGTHSSPHQIARLWVAQILQSFDAGRRASAWLAWSLIVLAPALLATLLHHLLSGGGNWVYWLALFALHVGILYLTLGFRQFSAYFSHIRDALEENDEASARATLGTWTASTPNRELGAGDILRRVLAQATLSAHVHVFGAMAAYCIGMALGLGPAGAVVYRLSELVARYCAHHSSQHQQDKHPISPPMLRCAQQAWQLLDWLPARISALLFAIVGNFEEAIASWRDYGQSSAAHPAAHAVGDSAGLVVAAASGALGVQMSLRPAPSLTPSEEAQSQASPALREPQIGHLQTMVGLVWRAVLVWMTLLALLTIASWT